MFQSCRKTQIKSKLSTSLSSATILVPYSYRSREGRTELLSRRSDPAVRSKRTFSFPPPSSKLPFSRHVILDHLQLKMSLDESLAQSARACEGAAIALAHSLRNQAAPANAPSNILETFREAEAFAITVRAVMDEAAPLLPLLAPSSTCVGRAPKLIHQSSRVHNGFDTIAVVLLSLFDTAVPAILDVAGNQSRWLVSPLQAKACFEKMATHHGQLRALYGIIHLAAKLVALTNTDETLFVNTGDGAHPELEPAKWRAAIKLDDFYGRHFGFHYEPEMRNVLRVVNIARGSVHKSHTGDDASASPLVKNMTMLGWGWVYSNMVLMNSWGLTIDGVSQIGADNMQGGMTIEALRKFMNLVEEPLVAGVSGLASVDVAIDTIFDIPDPGEDGGLPEAGSPQHNKELREILVTVDEPVSVRIMSAKNRPMKLPSTRRRQQLKATVSAKENIHCKERNGSQSALDREGVSDTKDATPERRKGDPLHGANGQARRPVADARQGAGIVTDRVVDQNSKPKGHGSEHKGKDSSPAVREDKTNVTNGTNSADSPKQPSPRRRRTIGDKLAGAAENSYLASTIKTELCRLQSNVSSFLGIEEPDPASGLILHFHGGGFVSQSTESHAVYMKEWVAEVEDSVLVSVEYKLAPEYRFPVALHQCVYTYLWVLQNASLLGTRADRVVFAGDSAGGNLAVATAMCAQKLGLRLPDGICVAYPALYVKTAWSPSRLLSFFDPLLPLSVLELCVKSYMPEGEGEVESELMSPVLASDEMLRKLPEISIVCGSFDPLLDDAVLFADCLRKAGRKGDILRVYEAMPHGFLNMNQVSGAARGAMRFMAKRIAEHLGVELKRRNREASAEVQAAKAAVTEFDG